MRASLRLLCGVVLLAVGTMVEAQAQDSGAVYLVTYVEAKPSAKKEAATVLKDLREASRKGDGNLHSEVVESTSRPGQFVVLTTWKDQKALDAHMAAAATKDLPRQAARAAQQPGGRPRPQQPDGEERRVRQRPACRLRGDPRGRSAAAQGRLHCAPAHARRREPQGRREPALRHRSADQPAEPLHRDRGVEIEEGVRGACRRGRMRARSATSSRR